MSYEYKTVIDTDGYLADRCVLVIDGVLQHFELKDGQELIDFYADGTTVKPKWNGTTWEETATTDEIKKHNEIIKIP
ncbi:hypothetical protein [Clostridium saccharoperbutylacetonicum]|uniref:hypothetical protein n=1 Tax=Clostridium saccharoperbutylacetonicum TaxID=36745 RepID=UPI0039EC094C